jgi:hypothetical protein
VIDKIMAPKIAAVHVLISNPTINAEQIRKTIPLTTKVKRPRVRTFRGKVKKIRTGQIRIFARPIITAAISADVKD